MIESIKHLGRQIAIIIRNSFYSDGIEFFTPDDYSQQLGYMNRPRLLSYLRMFTILFHAKFISQKKFYLLNQENYVSIFMMMIKIISKAEFLNEVMILLAFGGHGFQMLRQQKLLRLSKDLMLVMLIKHVSSQLT